MTEKKNPFEKEENPHLKDHSVKEALSKLGGKEPETLESKAGLVAAEANKQDEQLANLVEEAKKKNQELNREAVEQIKAEHVKQEVPLVNPYPYYLSPKKEQEVKDILKNSGADSASQIKALAQLKEVLETP
jgi:hypothetical protein